MTHSSGGSQARNGMSRCVWGGPFSEDPEKWGEGSRTADATRASGCQSAGTQQGHGTAHLFPQACFSS